MGKKTERIIIDFDGLAQLQRIHDDCIKEMGEYPDGHGEIEGIKKHVSDLDKKIEAIKQRRAMNA